VKSGPQVSFVGMAFCESTARKRLTRTASRPDLVFVWPFGEPERERPAADSSEEVTLIVVAQFIGFDIADASFIHDSIGDCLGAD
jgi:hypothetical protein